ncbi:MAG: HD domain-containing protein, partial [Planctomycetota bacterium]
PELARAAHAAAQLPPIPISASSLAGWVACSATPLRIDDVATIAADAPYAFDPATDRRTGYTTRSMMVLPLREPEGAVIGVLQLLNARDEAGRVVAFDPALTDLLMSMGSQAAVALHNARLAAALRNAYEETVFRLAAAAEMRDRETGEHVRRVALYAQALALQAGLPAERAEDIKLASPLHDVGKIAIPDAILRKPGGLTEAERREMQRHTVYGARLLEGSDLPPLKLAREIALSHHERWDGSGYPHGLAGEDIPLSARIVAVVDVFDALSSQRVYKEAVPLERCHAILRREAGRHFDPALVDAFTSIASEIEAIRRDHPDPPPGVFEPAAPESTAPESASSSSARARSSMRRSLS